MPTYEYRCPAGHDFEKFYRKISDAGAEVPCPQCGQVGARRISAGAGLVFKGSGFYITDYGKDGKKDQPSASRSRVKPEGGGDASGSSASTSDSATTSEAKASTDARPAASAPSKDAKPAPAPAAKPGKTSSE